MVLPTSLRLLACLAPFISGASAQATSPPVYPSPNATGAGGWDAAFAKAQAFVNELTLDEKAYLVTGVPGPCVGSIAPIQRLGFNGLCLQDGPLAIRQADYVSAFPAGFAAVASWDRDLINQRGILMAQEFKAKGAHVALGPVVGPLGRSALAGRNWEGFSPDPYLTGQAVSYTITGMQSTGLQACVKHYVAYEQETQRNPSTGSNGTTIEAVSSNLDDRTIHELYTWPFAEAVKAGVASVMCSYNRINETYACQNSKTMNGILKEELGFQGYVVSDWGGTHSGVPAIQAGLDMDMPGGLSFSPTDNTSFFGGNVTMAVNNGSLPLSRLNDMILRIMTPYYFLNQDTYPSIDPGSAAIQGFEASSSQYQWNIGPTILDVRGNHSALIRELGAASATLLKNTNNTLPLTSPPKVIAVFGNDAADFTIGEYSAASQNPFGYDIGTLGVGGGSGTARFSYVVPPLEAIKAWARAESNGSLVQYVTDNTQVGNYLNFVSPPPDVCFVFLKTWASEGSDRTSLDVDWDGNDVVTNVTSICNNTIVVTHSSGPNVLPWADNENVTAIIASHFPGQESGNAIVDVISGKVNPSGRLPFTIAYNATDYNAPLANFTGSTDPNAWQANFTEGLLIDYRHFDAANITPRYEFGFGLSYTTFNVSNLQVTSTGNASATPPAQSSVTPGGNPALWDVLATATFTLANTGNMTGSAVPQLYLAFPQGSSPSGTPPQVLRGFDKCELTAGQSTSVTFNLTRKDFSYWDINAQDWHIPSGSFGVKVGQSSRNIQATGSVSIL